MASSPSGKLLFVAFSDNSLKMIDMRVPEKDNVVRDFKGGHQDELIKSLLVSPDQSVLYSGGTDGVVCIWDINHSKVVETYGQSKLLRE